MAYNSNQQAAISTKMNFKFCENTEINWIEKKVEWNLCAILQFSNNKCSWMNKRVLMKERKKENTLKLTN